MHEIPVVKRRARIWPIVLMLILLAMIVLGAFWAMGYFGTTEITVSITPSIGFATGSA
jgi:hypothetical protein